MNLLSSLLECLARPATAHSVSCGLWPGLQGWSCVVSQAGRPSRLQLERPNPGSHSLGVWLGDNWDLPKAPRPSGVGRASTMVHLSFRALSNSQTVGNRELSDRGLVFPGGESETKTDESFSQW